MQKSKQKVEAYEIKNWFSMPSSQSRCSQPRSLHAVTVMSSKESKETSDLPSYEQATAEYLQNEAVCFPMHFANNLTQSTSTVSYTQQPVPISRYDTMSSYAEVQNHQKNVYEQPIYPQQNSPTSRPSTLQRQQLGRISTFITCPYCHCYCATKIKHVSGTCAYLSCALMFLSIVGTCCSCLPLCCNGTKDVEHYCSSCRSLLGTYRKL